MSLAVHTGAKGQHFRYNTCPYFEVAYKVPLILSNFLFIYDWNAKFVTRICYFAKKVRDSASLPARRMK
eukprot:scaffold379_cov383-Pavlova_lutheri.AAC.5